MQTHRIRPDLEEELEVKKDQLSVDYQEAEGKWVVDEVQQCAGEQLLINLQNCFNIRHLAKYFNKLFEALHASDAPRNCSY